ncbi:hypothetical protein VCV18_007021 [Metarhizium anisopliae]
MLARVLVAYAMGLVGLVGASLNNVADVGDETDAATGSKCGTILGIPCPEGYRCMNPTFCADCEGKCVKIEPEEDGCDL